MFGLQVFCVLLACDAFKKNVSLHLKRGRWHVKNRSGNAGPYSLVAVTAGTEGQLLPGAPGDSGTPPTLGASPNPGCHCFTSFPAFEDI